MHLYRAYEALKNKGKFQNLDINFYKTKDHLFYGDSNISKFCEMYKNKKIKPFKNKIICIYDRDNEKIVKKTQEKFFNI